MILFITLPTFIGATLLFMTVAVLVSIKIRNKPEAVPETPVAPQVPAVSSESIENTETVEFNEMKSGTFLENPKGDQTKSAILFGINVCDPNVYQGDRLQLKGCVNDSKSVLSFLQKKGFGKIWYNEDADCSVANFLRVWKTATKDLKDGDTLVLQMSRHGMSLGMNVLDRKGDDEVEKGEYKGDQAAVMYDGLIVDDCFWRLFLDLPKVKLIFINDSCHSGSQYKVANLDLSGKGKPLPYKKARSVGKEYMPKKDNVLDTAQLDREFGQATNKERRFDLISISGCQDWETSSDALLNGRYAGAMTYCLMSALNTSGRKPLSEIAKQVAADLKAKGFEQNPRIIVEGDQSLLSKPLF